MAITTFHAGTPFERGNNEVVVNEEVLIGGVSMGLFISKDVANKIVAFDNSLPAYGLAGLYFKDDHRQQVVKIANSIFVQSGTITATEIGTPLYLDAVGKATDVSITTGVLVGYLKSFEELVPTVFSGLCIVNLDTQTTATCVRMDLIRPVLDKII